MSLFFETVKYQKGEFFLMDYHAERLNRTRFEKLGLRNPINPIDFLDKLPEDDGLYKCRMNYAEGISKVTFKAYKAALHQKVLLKECGDYDYSFKYADRVYLNNAVSETDAEDVIFLKNGKLTDASYSNLAFFDGTDWFTPKSYLLKGVKRQFLIDSGFLKVKEISKGDLTEYKKIAFINAMRDFELVYSFTLDNNEIHLTLES
ncbi:aminotransferase class IV [uncultured Arcticibacterium sp.]|uniref:aminotransferase class IV n=1 Tax=uncultured Arcticibacterium sp. TaxID=2173042 RepID=UPI0030FB469F